MQNPFLSDRMRAKGAMWPVSLPPQTFSSEVTMGWSYTPKSRMLDAVGSISALYLGWYNIQADSLQGNFWHIKPRSKLGHLKSYPCATDTKIELAAVS